MNTATPTTFVTAGKSTDYTKNPPAAVSKNLRRLMDEAGMNVNSLAKATNIGKTTVRRFADLYEPPTNHPLLQAVARSLAIRLRRPAHVVLEELVKGGTPADYTRNQWNRITGAIGRKTKTAVTKPTKRTPKAPSLEPAAIVARSKKVKAVAAQPTNGTKPVAADELRTMVTTINMARMKGEKFLTVPIDTMTEMVSAALKDRGVNPNEVLIKMDFVDTF